LKKGGLMTRLRHGVYASVSALALLAAREAYGQPVMTAQTEAVPEQVLITGSLLGAANFSAPTPVTQVSEVQVQTRALTGIGTIVEELPYAQTGQGLTRNTSGITTSGQSFPVLRGLGANDTLVLINGQRPTPTNATSNFDTNMIPQSLLDRFEVVTTGASATYGSDAVAGVVNFILKDRLEGFTGNTQYGASQRGDENQFFGSFGWGTALLNGRGHFIIGGEFADEYNAVNMYARPWGRREPPVTAPVTLTAATQKALSLPANILVENTEVANSTLGGLISACQRTTGAAISNCPLIDTTFDINGSPSIFQRGAIGGNAFMVGTGNYGVSDMARELSPPYKRWASLARFEYDITPDMQAFATLNYGQLESTAPTNGSPVPFNFKILSGNPFIPASIQNSMTANNIGSITLSKLLVAPDVTFVANNKTSLVQSFFGVKGTLLSDYNWQVLGSAGRTTAWQGQLNVSVPANLDASLYAVRDATGSPVCGPLSSNPLPFLNAGNGLTTLAQLQAQVSPGCVPYNPFGTPSAAAINYVTNTPNGQDAFEANVRQYMVEANIAGPIYTLPAGPIEAAFGANYRYDSYNRRGSPAAVQNLFQIVNPQSFYINQSVHEIYGEVGVPIVRDLPFTRAIDLNAAGRYTDYSITGGVYTWKFGGTWDITDEIRLRATRSQDIRAPNFQELVNTPTTGAQSLLNPINGTQLRLGTVTTTGNPDLKPEVAQNFTAGVVWRPDSLLPGFRASVDYYRIRISGQISSVGGQDVINRCLNLHLTDFCSDIAFAANVNPNTPWTSFAPGGPAAGDFGINALFLVPVNLNAEVQDGVDINISQLLPLDWAGIPGTLQLSALGSYISQQTLLQSQSNGTVARTNLVDSWTAPRWAWNVNFTYLIDRFTTNIQMRYYSPLKFVSGGVFFIGPDDPQYGAALAAGSNLTINRETWPAAITWNLSLAYDVIQEPNGRNLQVYFNVDNLLDKDPPLIWGFVSNYNVVGRYFKMGIRYTMP
jgi:outer membrane receptor protein involved in Fe transport